MPHYKTVSLSLFPNLLKDFNKKLNPDIDPFEIKRTSTKILWKCSKCSFEWTATVGNRIKPSRQTGCPKCSKGLIREKQRKIAIDLNGTIVEKFPELLKDWDYLKNVLSPEELSIRSKEKVHWVCHKCEFKWITALQNRTKPTDPTDCPSCSKRISKLEETFHNSLRKLYNGEIIRNSKVIKRRGKRGLEIDFLLPTLKIGFEIQDFATHSKNFDNEISEFKGLTLVKRGPKYHENKRILAKEQLDVVLYDVWEDLIRDFAKLEEFLEKVLK